MDVGVAFASFRHQPDLVPALIEVCMGRTHVACLRAQTAISITAYLHFERVERCAVLRLEEQVKDCAPDCRLVVER